MHRDAEEEEEISRCAAFLEENAVQFVFKRLTCAINFSRFLKALSMIMIIFYGIFG